MARKPIRSLWRAAARLAEIEVKYVGVAIGSHPFFNDALRGVSFVARGRDKVQLQNVETDLNTLVASLTCG